MKTRTMIWVSAAFWVCVAYYNGSELGAVLAAVAHALFFQGHNIEVKLNKLLDHYGLTVSNEDLD